VLSLRGLRQQYANRVVLDVPAWDVEQGAHALVLGPSGSGKSTLINAIAGLVTPTAGEVRFGGTIVTALSPGARDAFRARNIGLVMQTLHLIGVLDVAGNLALARTLAGLPRDDERIEQVLASLGVAGLKRQKASRLSLGEQQRVAVARAVVNRPKLILADEPTSALDDANCEATLALLFAQAEECGATLVVATHDKRIVPRFSRSLVLA
jgi:putative ABC transport system ATP-binding protein